MIYLGADHGGYNLKEKIKLWLTEWELEWQDLGNTKYEKEDDYPQFAFKVAKKVAEELERLGNRQEALGSRQQATGISWKESPKGIILCRSAAGMVIAANKVKGIRAVAVFDERSAKLSREKNDANILALSNDFLEDEKNKQITKIWLETEFSGSERHVRRLREIRDYEETQM